MSESMTEEELYEWASVLDAPEAHMGDTTTLQAARAVLALLGEVEAYRDLGPCTWTEDEDYDWTTTCGHPFSLNEGRPSDNGMVYCPMCGRKLLEQPYVVPLDEED